MLPSSGIGQANNILKNVPLWPSRTTREYLQIDTAFGYNIYLINSYLNQNNNENLW